MNDGPRSDQNGPPRPAPAPPSPPSPPPPGQDRPSSIPLLVGVGVVVIALAAASGGAWWRPNGDVDHGGALRRGLVGASIALAVVAVALVVARRWWRTLPRPAVVAAAAFVIALGWLLGLAGAPPPQPTEADGPAAPELPDRPAGLPDGIDPGSLGNHARASLVDADGDGRPDRDADGNLIIALDADGDGRYDDGFLVPCDDDWRYDDQVVDDDAPGRHDRLVVDLTCDGRIDGRIRVSPNWLSSMPNGLPTDIDRPDRPDDQQRPDEQRDERPDEPAPDDDQDGDSSFGAVFKTLLIVAAIAAAAWVLWLVIRAIADRRNGGGGDDGAAPLPPPDEPEIDAAAVDAALESSIETLLSSPDPRVAIRAAYAVLLDALAEAGFARRPYEAPEEHLSRCLQGLEVRPAPMRRLLELFSIARFSTHDVTEDDRAAALDALRASQRELREPASADPGTWAPPESP